MLIASTRISNRNFNVHLLLQYFSSSGVYVAKITGAVAPLGCLANNSSGLKSVGYPKELRTVIRQSLDDIGKSQVHIR
jgi:hypothetical protein